MADDLQFTQEVTQSDLTLAEAIEAGEIPQPPLMGWKTWMSWRKFVALAATQGVPTPTFSSALAYYDSYRSARLPQNLLQAQRDYFGAHTYERVDEERGRFFHIDWPAPERPQIEA